MDGAIWEGMQVEEVGLLSFLYSFSSAGKIAALHLHTQMPTPLGELSFLGGMGGQEQLAYLAIPCHFHLLQHPEKAWKKLVICQNFLPYSSWSIKIMLFIHQLYILYNIVMLTGKVTSCVASILFWFLQPILARTFSSSLKLKQLSIYYQSHLQYVSKHSTHLSSTLSLLFSKGNAERKKERN